MFWVKMAGIFMFLAVVLGAFGAHGLKNKLTADNLDIYRTAVLYHAIHALALFVVAWLSTYTLDGKIQTAGALFCLGIVLFSGSLYVLAVTGIRGWGAITPLGGVCFLGGWLFIVFSRLSL